MTATLEPSDIARAAHCSCAEGLLSPAVWHSDTACWAHVCLVGDSNTGAIRHCKSRLTAGVLRACSLLSSVTLTQPAQKASAPHQQQQKRRKQFQAEPAGDVGISPVTCLFTKLSKLQPTEPTGTERIRGQRPFTQHRQKVPTQACQQTSHFTRNRKVGT